MFNRNICLALLLVLELTTTLEASGDVSKRADEWNVYKARLGKKYKDANEEARRKAIFESNKEMIEQFNADPKNSFKLALNEYADETLEEAVAKRTGLKRLDLSLSSSSSSDDNLLKRSGSSVAASISSYPTSLDYSKGGLVSAVKNQGVCGSCWAFAVAQAVEAASFKAYGRMISPSEQQMVDCDTRNYGCDGGFLEYAFAYMSGGIQNDTTYPYVSGKDGKETTCSATRSRYVVSTKTSTYPNYRTSTYGRDFGSFIGVPDSGNGDSSSSFYNLTIAGLNDIGPATIAVCVGSKFDSYKSGVYDNSGVTCTNAYLNHAILLVGYNRSSSNSNEHVWIAKNQWGKDWGHNGYIYIKMGAGLIRETMFPVLSNTTDTITTTVGPTTTRSTRSTGSRTTAARTTRTTRTRTTRTRTTRTRTTRTRRTTRNRG